MNALAVAKPTFFLNGNVHALALANVDDALAEGDLDGGVMRTLHCYFHASQVSFRQFSDFDDATLKEGKRLQHVWATSMCYFVSIHFDTCNTSAMNATETPLSLMAVITSVAFTADEADAAAADDDDDAAAADDDCDDFEAEVCDGTVASSIGPSPSASGVVSHAPLTQSIAISMCRGPRMECTRAIES